MTILHFIIQNGFVWTKRMVGPEGHTLLHEINWITDRFAIDFLAMFRQAWRTS